MTEAVLPGIRQVFIPPHFQITADPFVTPAVIRSGRCRQGKIPDTGRHCQDRPTCVWATRLIDLIVISVSGSHRPKAATIGGTAALASAIEIWGSQGSMSVWPSQPAVREASRTA
jgi:hypothetical protein